MDIKELLDSEKIGQLTEIFSSKKPVFEMTPEKAVKQYDVDGHDVHNKSKRKPKIIKKDTGSVDELGKPILATVSIDVNRVGIPFQKLIVERRVGFALSTPVTYRISSANADDEQAKKLIQAVNDIQDDNKMAFKNKEILRRLMSEMEVAEIWYFAESDKDQIGKELELNMKILSPDLGDKLYPLFDAVGDMIAFARGYKVTDDKKVQTEHFDIYTNEAEYHYINKSSTWIKDPDIPINPIPNKVHKIMIVYYSQNQPEWYNVQDMIGRLETLYSNHADSNDYFGAPMLLVSGEVEGYAQKGEQGKIMQLSPGADAKYLALQNEPQSITAEEANLERLIYTMSQTPNIDFEAVKSLGNLSGVALRLMFLDAHMAVKCKEEIFGIGLQRRVNIIKACIGTVLDTSLNAVVPTTKILPIITPYLPDNDSEMINNISAAYSSGILSKKTSVERNPLVSDPDKEVEQIDQEVTGQIETPIQKVTL